MSDVTNTQKTLTELLPAEAIAEVDVWVSKYPEERKRSAVMGALMVAQNYNNNYLSQELMNAVSDYLQIPHIAAYEVATFYTMYNLEPVGKHVINICTNISCMLRGSEDIVKHCESKLGIKLGETTDDKLITLREVECAGACAGAPMCEVDKVYHENITPEFMDNMISQFKSEG
jgi:NADH-quinone oxidoreductase subunit E